eukprot:s573_g10.t1
MLGALLEVELLKKCTALWREAHFQVKMLKAPWSRQIGGAAEAAEGTAAAGAAGAPRLPDDGQGEEDDKPPPSRSTDRTSEDPLDRRERYQHATREEVSDGDLGDFLHSRPAESLPDEVPGDDELYNEAIESETETSDGDYSRVTNVAATPSQEEGDM